MDNYGQKFQRRKNATWRHRKSKIYENWQNVTQLFVKAKKYTTLYSITDYNFQLILKNQICRKELIVVNMLATQNGPSDLSF